MNRILPAALLLLLAACRLPQGARTEVSSRCTSAWHRGSCSITLDLLEASYTYPLSNPDFHYYGSSTEIKARISTKQGRVKFWFKEPNLTVREVIVEPGRDATIEGPAYVWDMADKHEVDLYFQFLDQGPGRDARGVKVDIQYRMGPQRFPWNS